MQRANDQDYSGNLFAPAKQISFLLGLFFSTPEPKNPRDRSEDDWAIFVSLLNEAFIAYQDLFWPSKQDLASLSDEWKRTRQVAMPTFMHYFSTDLLATVDQVVSRIETYLAPFDPQLEELMGLTSRNCVAIARWINQSLQTALEEFNEAVDSEQAARIELEQMAKIDGLSESEIMERAISGPYRTTAEALNNAINSLGVVSSADLFRSFPATGQAYWRLFTISRGDGPDIQYPTETSIFETKPLILLDEENAICPEVNRLFTSILSTGQNALLDSNSKRSYLSRRDKSLEHETVEHFISMLDKGAVIQSNTYETPDAQFEHDIVALSGSLILIIEVKASPPVEPFRDPDRAFTRLKHSFRADTGIQGAFNQAERIRSRLAAGEVVKLYDEKGEELVSIDPSVYHNRFSVTVTRDDFGPLATDLALLLEKDADTPYPWAVNILDLASLVEAWQYLNWGTDRLTEYLSGRAQCHGLVFGSDELEFAGYYIQHGDLGYILRTKADFISLEPSYSDFFDQLYRHLQFGTTAPEYDPHPPFLMDLKRSLIKDEPVFVTPTGEPLEKSNATTSTLCPCGSGLVFEECHGKTTT